MRIGYYIPAWPPGSTPNGIVTTLGHLGRVLRESGHEVFYVTQHAPKDHSDGRVFVLERAAERSILERLLFRWNLEKALYQTHSAAIARSVSDLVERFGIDIFQMEETQGWASKVIQRVSIPVVVRLHGPWFLNRELGPSHDDRPENGERVDREGRAICAAAGIAAPSSNVLDLTEQLYGRLPSPSQVIPNPIYGPPKSNLWKIEKCDRDLMLFVGRFDRIKGADLILKAFSKVAQQRPNARLTFVGPDIGLVNNSDSGVNFQEFVSMEIPENVRLRIDFRGPLTRAEIEALRTRAYVTLVGSRYETFGNVVIEAMSFGCPIVTTGVGGILEIVTDGRNGLIAAADADSIADTITQILDNPELASKLGAQAALDCVERFDPVEIGRRTIDFYSTVIDRWQHK